jgi:hypothetical protein
MSQSPLHIPGDMCCVTISTAYSGRHVLCHNLHCIFRETCCVTISTAYSGRRAVSQSPLHIPGDVCYVTISTAYSGRHVLCHNLHCIFRETCAVSQSPLHIQIERGSDDKGVVNRVAKQAQGESRAFPYHSCQTLPCGLSTTDLARLRSVPCLRLTEHKTCL